MRVLILLFALLPATGFGACHILEESGLKCTDRYFVPANSTRAIDIWLEPCRDWASPAWYIGVVQSRVDDPGIIPQEIFSSCWVPISRIAITNTTDELQFGRISITYDVFR